MLLSLLVYSLTGASLFFLGWHVNRREKNLLLQGGKTLPFYSWEILLSLLLFAVIAGARYHTGYDHKMYLDQYLHLQQTGEFSRNNFEYGFEWISKLFACCHIHYFFYFAFWALLQIGFVYYALKDRKHLLCWVGLGIMCGSYFLGWMNSVRQSVIVCLFVALVPLIRDRKWLPYVAIVIISAFIHKSALLLIPVFLLSYVNLDKKIPSNWILLVVFAVFVLLGIRPFWIDWFTNYQWFLDLTGYDNYGNLNDPNVVGKFRMINWGPSRIAILAGNILTVLYYPKLKAHFKGDTLFSYFFALAFVGMCISNLLINTTHFILRPTEYFTIFYLIMGAYLMTYFTQTHNYYLWVVVFFVLYSDSFINIIKAVYYPNVTNQPFLYHTFLFSSI